MDSRLSGFITLCCLLLVVLAGCGGQNAPRLTPVMLTIEWPERSREVAAPSSALSCRITLDESGGEGEQYAWLINRQSDVASYSQQWVSPESVPARKYLVTVTFYAEPDAGGALVAEARQEVTVADRGGDLGTLALSRKVATVEVMPDQRLALNEQRDLLFTARDGVGAVIAVTPGSARWTVVGDRDHVRFIAGQAEGRYAGTVDITATVDGVTSAAASVVVAMPGGQAIGDERINPRDGASLVWVPAGEFIMGSPTGEGFVSERPLHTVYLDGYWIYKYEVTVAQYRQFCEATGRAMPRTPSWGWHDNDPIVNVTWYGAAAYAEWAGGVLPSEAQWEKAARGTDGQRYPWGDAWDASLCANKSNCYAGDEPSGTKPVGSYPAGVSPFGAWDMAGNAWEWCADWYQESYFSQSPPVNPTGPESGIYRVVRGGSLHYDNPFLFRCAYRNTYDPPERYSWALGMRCGMNP